MIEVIERATGRSIVYTTVGALNRAAGAGVPPLLLLNVVHRLMQGGIEPVITDGGLRYSVANETYRVSVYHAAGWAR